jgi:carbon starvation protein CstA
MMLPALLVAFGLFLAVDVAVGARSGKIGGRLGRWVARKEKMPVLFYGSLITEGVMAVCMMVSGVVCFVRSFSD